MNYCELRCSNLKNNSLNPGFCTWTTPEGLTSVMLEYREIGWRTMRVKWLAHQEDIANLYAGLTADGDVPLPVAPYVWTDGRVQFTHGGIVRTVNVMEHWRELWYALVIHTCEFGSFVERESDVTQPGEGGAPALIHLIHYSRAMRAYCFWKTFGYARWGVIK